MQYQVRFVHPGDPAVQVQVLEADDEGLLRSLLQSQGKVVLGMRKRRRWSHGRQAAHEYPVFCRQLRTLVRAGMTVVEAVETLSARDGSGPHATPLALALRQELRAGKSLSHALAMLPSAPPVLVAAVRAAERTSNLAEALDGYLRFDDLVQRLRRKVVSASLYPALVTTLGIAITLFLLLAVLPGFARMYQNVRGRPVGLGAWMIEASIWIHAHRAIVFCALALAALLLAWWISGGGARKCLQVLLRQIPWLRQRVGDFHLAMLYQALSLLLRGGYPMTQAMAIAGDSAVQAHVRAALACARQKVEEGALVSAALASQGLCTEVDRRLMGAAERNGDFHLAAEVVAHLHGERFELFIERTTRIVEPLLLLLVAMLVGGVVVAMYLPVFDVAMQLR